MTSLPRTNEGLMEKCTYMVLVGGRGRPTNAMYGHFEKQQR